MLLQVALLNTSKALQDSYTHEKRGCHADGFSHSLACAVVENFTAQL